MQFINFLIKINNMGYANMVYKAGLLISILFLHACNDNNNSLKTKSSVNPSIKEKPEPIIKKESEVLESDLIGVWKIDSMFGDINAKMVKTNLTQGYNFTDFGIAMFFEKKDNSLKEMPNGDYIYENNSLVIGSKESHMNGKVQKWKTKIIDNKNLVMTGQFTMSESIGKPILFLSKIPYDSIAINHIKK